MKVIRLLLLTLIALIIHACAVNPVTGKKELMLMSVQEEKAMGEQSDKQIVATFGLYDDDRLQKFIDVKGQEMARISHRPELEYKFKILDSPVVNAFAVPGGYVYFTRGILAHFSNEAEFAGVLGHEIGHIAARHSAQQYSKSMLAQLGLVAGMVISEDFRQFAGLAQQGLGLLFLKFSRDNESESDRLGVEYSTKVGYNAHNMAEFFNTLDRMRSQSGNEPLPTFLSTHPDPGNREERVHELTDEWQNKVKQSNYITNRETYLHLLDGMIYGEDPRQGYIEDYIFYHPELLFKFPIPSNWKTMNMPAQVQMSHPEGNAAIILSLSQQQSLEEAARTEVEKYKLQIESYEDTRVNGLRAYRMISVLQNEQDPSKSLRLQSYFIDYDGNIYVFHGVASKDQFSNYRGNFNYTMEQFGELNNPSKINVTPDRLHIKKVKKTGSIENALRAYNVPDDRLEELALINNAKLNDNIEAGQLIKVLGK